MDLPLEIVYRDVKPSPEVEELVRGQAEKLFQLYSRIERCRVTLEIPARRQQKGNRCHVAIHMVVPGNDLHVNRDPTNGSSHEDLRVAVHDAFQAAQRRLRDFTERFQQHPPRPGKG